MSNYIKALIVTTVFALGSYTGLQLRQQLMAAIYVLLVFSLGSYTGVQAKPYTSGTTYVTVGGVRTGDDGSLCTVRGDRTFCHDGSLGITRGNTTFIVGGGMYQRQGDIISGDDGTTCVEEDGGRVTVCF